MNKKQQAIVLGRKPKHRQSIKQIIYEISPIQNAFESFCFGEYVQEMLNKIFAECGIPEHFFKAKMKTTQIETLGGEDWGSLPQELCPYCFKQGGIEFLSSENPLDLIGPQVVRCTHCKRTWDASNPAKRLS